MNIQEIKNYLEKPIDRFSLETELEQHAFVFQEATKELAQLRFEADVAKRATETVQYKIELAVRADFEATNKKVTEATVAAEVKTSGDYLNALDASMSAKRRYDEMDMLREAFMVREASLKMLVQLYGSQYWTLHESDKYVPKAAESSEGKFKQRAKAGE